MSTHWLNREVPVELTCPGCSDKFSKTLRELESDQDFTCPGCSLVFQPRDFTADLQAAEKLIDDLGRKLKREFGKR